MTTQTSDVGLEPGQLCPGGEGAHEQCTHPPGATLWLGGTAWAHPALAGSLLPVDQLTPYPGNARRGDQDAITAAVADLGIYKAQITYQTSTHHVLTGNHTLRGLLALGAVLAPATTLDVDDTRASAINSRDNHTSDLGGYDPAAQVEQLLALQDAELLALAGRTDDDLAALQALLAGDEAGEPVRGPSLADRFLVPPFSVLDQRQGVWQDRKRRWLGLGIVSEVGRGEEGRTLGAAQTNLDGKDAARYGRQDKGLGSGRTAHRDEATGQLVYEQMPHTETSGVSIFDPVLCELAYRWFSASDARVLDPFAGGSVRGVVAAALGRAYTGVELRPEQVAANDDQWTAIGPLLPDTAPAPEWTAGDARDAMPPADSGGYDLLFSCPPYADLEVYSDDPADLSAMAWPDFLAAYRAIIASAVDLLAPDRFAVWVIGEVRDKRGHYRNLVGETTRAFTDAGASYYNEAILISPAGSLPLRAGKQFAVGRKLGKTHQNVLVFCKGNPRAAAEACGPVDVTLPDAWGVPE